MYILGNPDHYTSHSFVNFYWQSFVNEAMRTSLDEMHAELPEPTVVITPTMKAASPIFDYIYRPVKYSEVSLYDWIQKTTKKRGGLKGRFITADCKNVGTATDYITVVPRREIWDGKK